jgi:nitroreductase
MIPIPCGRLIEHLRWRYATREFDSEKRISAEVWETLEESLRLTPSSFGLQPWKFLVIVGPKIREKLKAVSWDQDKVTDASHLVVFAVKRQNTPEEVDAFIADMAETRGLQANSPSLAGRREGIHEYGEHRSHIEWNARQAYIALGTFLTSAALLGVDTCPIEGMEPDRYDEILELASQNLTTVVACVAGYRADDDAYAQMPKVRFKKEHVIQYR